MLRTRYISFKPVLFRALFPEFRVVLSLCRAVAAAALRRWRCPQGFDQSHISWSLSSALITDHRETETIQTRLPHTDPASSLAH